MLMKQKLLQSYTFIYIYKRTEVKKRSLGSNKIKKNSKTNHNNYFKHKS